MDNIIKQQLVDWSLDICSFYQTVEQATASVCGYPLAQVYSFLQQVEKRNSQDQIRPRILLYALGEWAKSRLTGRYYNEIVDDFITAIAHSDLDTNNRDAIRRKLQSWVNKGQRYSQLGEELGGPGVLVLLPETGGSDL